MQVRISEAQYNDLKTIAEPFHSSVNGLVQDAVNLWLEVEGPIWTSKARELKPPRPKKVTS